MSSATVSVIVPTYGRPQLLRRCLLALETQIRAPEETIVVVRRNDEESQRVATEREWNALRLVEVDEPGVLAAMRSGVAASSGDFVAFTDDDAEPAPDWLGLLVSLLERSGAGAAGGRDVIPGQTTPRRRDVGRLTRYGKLVGNHHLGTGPPRDVDVLKGVNMGFRAECLALPRPGLLRGDGAEVHFEVLCARWAQRAGWRVVYDPSIEVAHLGAERVGVDRRRAPAQIAVRDAAYNFLVATVALDRGRLPRQALYALALGSRDAPGLGRGLVALARGERTVLRRVGPSLAGSLLAVARLAARPDHRSLVTSAELRAAQPREVSVA